MDIINPAALVLLEFYMSKSGDKRFDFTDEAVSKILNWKLTRVRDLRQELQKANLFSRIAFTNKEKGKHYEITLCQLFIDAQAEKRRVAKGDIDKAENSWLGEMGK